QPMGEFVAHVVEEFRLKRPHAVGSDIGTSALLFTAAKHPGLLRSIIVMTKNEVLKVHTDVFYAALTRQNYAALEELYSDDYMLVRPDGSLLNKQEVLQDLRNNGLRFHSIDPRQLVVRI